MSMPADGPCSPHQLVSGLWVAPLCLPLPQIFVSPWTPRAGFREQDLPAEVDHRKTGVEGPVKYQASVGVCWAFALSSTMDNAAIRMGHRDEISPMHIVSSKTWNTLWDARASIPPHTIEPTWPYDPAKACKLVEGAEAESCEKAYDVKAGSWRNDPEIVAEKERADRSPRYRITRIDHIKTDPVDVRQLMDILARGEDIWAAFRIDRKLWGHSQTAQPVLPEYEQGDSVHAVVLVGYRSVSEGRQFLLKNSWSDEWREGGYAWISERMVRKHLSKAFTVEIERIAAEPPPPRPQTEQPCPQGYAVDQLLGLCVPACDDGSAPTAGLCPVSPGPGTGRPTPAQPVLPWVCPAGQIFDPVRLGCAPPCPNGLPPAGGVCLP
ncbi:MAG: C1 family peptidase [Deltaproteobacteria bacterium]|nr:C1 family peptidase [Deltaproteobacteria bacterium]